jgi:uncharacterized membrane protein
MGLIVNFAGGVPPWLGFTIAAAAIALTILSYLHTRKSSSPGYVLFLAGVRLFATLVLLAVTLRPLVTYKAEVSREGSLVILVDTSGSMSVRDYPNMPDRLESVKTVLADSPQMKALKGRFRVSTYAFDKGLTGEVQLANIANLTPSGKATELVATLNEAAARKETDTAGIIVFTDGIETVDKPGKYTGGIPVTTVAVGSKLSSEGAFRDIILTDVQVLPSGEPVVSKDNTAQIAAYVEGLGYAGRVVPVRLADGQGKVLAEENLTIDAKRGDQKVVLSYTPKERGNFKLTVEIPPQAEETIKENNVRDLNVTVTDPQIRVLYIEGTLRTEYKYILRVMQRDPNVRLLSLVRLSQRTFYQQGNVTDLELTGFPKDLETLRKFDVIMIGDLPASAFSAQDMANIKEAVSAGTGLVMLGGYNSFADGGYAGTPVADVLPVDLGADAGGQDKNEFTPELTGEGEVSPVFAGITDYFGSAGRKPVHEMPPLLGQAKIGAAKPGATVLATNPLRSDKHGKLAVLVMQTFGTGRSAAFAGDTTWRWYAVLKGREMESPYVRFWGQLVRWLARREVEEESGKPGVTLYVDKAFYALGDKVTATAEVRGADGLLTDKARIDATVEAPGGPVGQAAASIALGYVAGSKGTYSGAFEPSAASTFTVKANATQGGVALGEASAVFEVGVEDVEMRKVDLDEDHLRQIASESGGTYVPILEFGRYAASLEAKGEVEKTVEVLNLRQKRVLYPLFIIFVALMTVEWVWRKRIEMP